MVIKIGKWKIDITSLIYGLFLLGCYFLPWVHIGMLTFTGIKLPDSLLTLIKIAGLDNFISNMNLPVYALYLVPFLAVITTMLAFINYKSKVFSIITATSVYCLFFIYYHIFKTFDAHVSDLLAAIGIGVWLTLSASVIILLYNILYWIWKKRKTAGMDKKRKYLVSFLSVIGFILLTVLLFNITIGKGDIVIETPGEELLDLDKILEEYEEYYVDPEILEQVRGTKKQYINPLFDDPDTEWNQGTEPLHEFIERFTTDNDFQLSRVSFPVGEQIVVISGDCDENHPSYDEWFDACIKRVELTKKNWIPIPSETFIQKESDEENLVYSWTDLEKDFARFVIGWVESELAVRYEFSRTEDGKWYLTKLDDYLLYEE
ncbi:MAG: hypothetical protein LUG18_02675 [Candidatus Azobacteroides sp.]|nr:hypothetical protein [Candidatus Azobacteroides sp.]